MRVINKRNRKTSRYGATTMFLSIILSAVILIQCTYIAVVTDRDTRLAYNRGLKLQVEAILADYDRKLFRDYGIYAFDCNSIDNSVFYSVLSNQGLEYGSDILIEGTNQFDTDDIRKAISTFYMYRTTGILFNVFASNLSDSLDILSDNQIIEYLGEFTSSRAAGYLRSIIQGGESVTSALSAVSSFLNLTGLAERMDYFNSFLSDIRSLISSDPDYMNGFSIDSLEGLSGILDSLYSFNSSASDVISNYALRPFISHYSAYNFDSYLDEDTLINGESFDTIHSENYADAEYILTGLEGDSAVSTVKLLIFPAVLVLTYIGIINDSDTMAVINAIAEVLSAVIAVLTAGSATVPMEVYRAVIIAIYGLIAAVSGMDSILEGEKIEVVSINDNTVLELGYRDFIYIFLHFVDEDTQLGRISDILCRDFESYCTTVSASTTFRNSLLSTTSTYALYE